MWTRRDTITLAITTLATILPSAHVLPGHFNVVQMAIGVRKRASAALPAVEMFVNTMRSDGTVQKAIRRSWLARRSGPAIFVTDLLFMPALGHKRTSSLDLTASALR